jgi:hypothetical protein
LNTPAFLKGTVISDKEILSKVSTTSPLSIVSNSISEKSSTYNVDINVMYFPLSDAKWMSDEQIRAIGKLTESTFQSEGWETIYLAVKETNFSKYTKRTMERHSIGINQMIEYRTIINHYLITIYYTSDSIGTSKM